jgi:hypothetical protein
MLHGDYFVPETHGKLTPRRTIPDLDEFTAPQIGQYRNIIGAMDRELLRLATVSRPKRLDPAMSWQALSQLNLLPTSPPCSTKLASRVSVARCDSPAVKSEVECSGSQNFDGFRRTDSCTVGPEIGQSAGRSCKTTENLPIPGVIDVMQANELDCRSECDQEEPPDASSAKQ